MPTATSSKHNPQHSNGGRNVPKMPGASQAAASQRESLTRRRLGGSQQRGAGAPQTNQADEPMHQQQHVANSRFGQQHHSSRPSAWVIPFETVEAASTTNAMMNEVLFSDGSDTTPLLSDDDDNDDLPVITPDRPTPCISNARKTRNVLNLRGNHIRGLHNSHRKTKLHRIIPLETTYPQSDPFSNNPTLPIQMMDRGNGFVLDLTSLFTSGDATGAAKGQHPSEVVTTRSKSPVPLHYKAPTPPPWRIRAAAVASPMTAASDVYSNGPDDNNSIVNAFCREDLHWDTKSQTTQEALLTERQCQALTQWLNFILVGEQPPEENHNSAPMKSARRKLGASLLDSDDDNKSSWSHPTEPTHGGRSHWSHSTTRPATLGGRSVTPGGRYNTPTPNGRSTTPALSGATPNPRRHRRLSLFQYADSYEHAQDQAQHWFQHSPQWKELKRRIRSELASGKMTLRDDRNLYANVGCRDLLLELFCSYQPAWLTLALEVVMNETIATPQGQSVPTVGQLKRFIIQRVLMEAKLLSKYNQGRGSGTPSGKFEQAFQAELQPLVLYRILVLIFFLDRAAMRFQAQNNNSRLGNLFATKTKVKSTSQMLVLICREFLSRQGDIVKQLARANLHVYYVQDRLDEIEYPIVNFAVDLRDGVRLCRALEILWLLPRRCDHLVNNRHLSNNNGSGIDNSIKYPLLQQLRIPAISRLQKIHNVNVALAALQEQCHVGLPSNLQAHHIVDGQRRMVMRLIWTIVLMHCFESADMLTRKQVEQEIALAQSIRRKYEIAQERRQRQTLDVDSSLYLLEGEFEATESVALVSNDDKPVKKNRPAAQKNHSNLLPLLSLSQSKSASYDEDDDSNSTLAEVPVVQQWKAVLFKWCQQVCILVEEQERNNFLSLPGGARPPKRISPEQWTTTDLANGKALCCLIHHYHPTILPLEDLRLASTVVDGPPVRIQTKSSITLTGRFRHMRHQRRTPNVAPDYFMRLAQRRLTEIGGIPPMMLMPIDKNSKGQHRRKQSVMALGDQKSVLVFLYYVCARLIESRHQVQAVVFVQQRYLYLRNVTLWRQKLQAGRAIIGAWRENKTNYYRVRSTMYKRAVCIIEAFVARNFSKLLVLQERRLLRKLENLAVTPIQALVRRFLSNIQLNAMLERHAAATKVQARFRQFHEYHTYQILLLEIKPAATVVQRHWRGFIQRRMFASIIDAIITLQAFLRGSVAVQRYHLWSARATCIQRMWRGFWVQLRYQMDLLDVIAVQCLVRKKQAVLCALRRAHAVNILQRSARAFLARASVIRKRREKDAGMTIQKTFRRFLAMREAAKLLAALALLRATLVIQRSWRRTVFLRKRQLGALKIQTRFRMLMARAVFERQKSALLIQTRIRMWISRIGYIKKCVACLRIQTHRRQFAKRRQYRSLLKKIILVESCFRRWKYGLWQANHRKTALQIVQKYARRWLAVRLLNAMKKYRNDMIRSAIVCQALSRRNSQFRAFLRAKRSILSIQVCWRGFFFLKTFRRKQSLVSAISSCSLIFRRLQKGSFKIVPLTREAVTLNKQTHFRCGKKRIVLSNASTVVVPWHGHRQKLFRHRSHVHAVRLKYSSGVELRGLPRRPVTLRVLRNINEAAMRLQAPWTYAHLNRCTIMPDQREQRSRDYFGRIYAKRRARRAKKRTVDAVLSTVKRSVDAADPKQLTIIYSRDLRRMKGEALLVFGQLCCPARRLRQSVTSSRVLNLAHRNTALPHEKKTSDELFDDPFKKKIRLIAATKTAQKCWRNFAAKNRLRQEIRNIVIVQSIVRSYLAKKLRKATRTIIAMLQRTIKCFVCRQRAKLRLRKLAQEKGAVTKLQSVARGYMVRDELFILNACAAIIQKHARRCIALERTKVAAKALKDGKMAARIQAAWKRRIARVVHQNDLLSVLRVQRAVRRWLVRKRTWQSLHDEQNRAEVDAVVKIQSIWRSFTSQEEFIYALICTIQIQSWWRAVSQQKNYCLKLKEKRRALCFKKRASVKKIQSCIRRFLAKKSIESRLLAVVSIQRNIRGFLARQHLSLEHFAATCIQRVWRGYDNTSGFIYVVVSAIKLQSFFRMAKCKKVRQGLQLEKLQECTSTTRLHSLCRRLSAQNLALDAARIRKQRNGSAAKVQSLWRMAIGKKQASKLSKSILEHEKQADAMVKSQPLARKKLAESFKPELSTKDRILSPPKLNRTSVVETTALDQLSLAAYPGPTSPPEEQSVHQPSQIQPLDARENKLSDSSPAPQPLKSESEMHRRVSMSQGVVRGFLARRQSIPEVQKVQVLIKEAELRSKLQPSMRLGARMMKALHVLKTSRSLTEIMNVVCTIELATRFSRECCEEFVHAGAIAILVSLLYDLNKSLPHVELLYYIMRTLLNLCKHRSMVDRVATVETSKVFLHLIRMYGSEDAVFCSAVALLEVCAARNEEVRALLASPSSRKRMEGICQQWERKLNRRLALENPSPNSTPQPKYRDAPSQNEYTPQFMSKRNKGKTDMLILGISYDLQNGVTTFRQVLSRTI